MEDAEETIVILNLTEPSIMTEQMECHVTCSCGYASLFVPQSYGRHEAETHGYSHPNHTIKTLPNKA